MKPVEEYSSQDISLMEFREKLFLEEADRFVTAITGERQSLLPFIRDENGAYSEKKTWNLIQELIRCAHVYWEYHKEQLREEYRAEGAGEDFIETIAGASRVFSEKELTFLQSFLYCSLRISEANPWRNTGGVTQTFQDLILFSREHYEDLSQLYVAEATAEAFNDRYSHMKGIYRPASWLFHLFTGLYLSDLYTEQAQKNFFSHLPFYLQQEMKGWDCGTPSAYAKKMAEILDELGTFSEEEEDVPDEIVLRSSESIEREREEKKRRDEEAAQIREQFPESGQFVKQYQIFRNQKYAPECEDGGALDAEELSLESIVTGLPILIKGTVRLFTENHRLSWIQDDHAYFTAISLLRQSNKRFQKLGWTTADKTEEPETGGGKSND